MQNSKLYYTLQSLSKAEILRFKDYVASPFFNKHKETGQFLNTLLKLQEEAQDNSAPEKEAIFKALFPNAKTFEARKISDLSYNLLCLLEDFLSAQKFYSNYTLQKVHLLAEAQERKLEKTAHAILQEIEKYTETSTLQDADFHYHSFLSFSERDKYFSSKGRIKQDDSLQKKADALDAFYIATKLKDGCEMLNRRNILQIQYNYNLLEEIKIHVSNNWQKYAQKPAITIYYNILLMLQEPQNEDHFREVRALLQQFYHCFSRQEMRDGYNYVQNYCIRRINAGEPRFLSELFEIYKDLLSSNLILQDKFITQWDYKNITSIGLRLKEYDWVFNFIYQYKEKISPEQRLNAFTYNLANYYYETKNYKKAIKQLQSVDFTEVYYTLDARAMLLKIYFEMEEEEAFYSLISAFKIYLHRNKLVSEQNILIYNNLIKFSNKVFKLKLKPDYLRGKAFEKDVLALKTKISETKSIANLPWLMEKVDELLIS